MTVGIYCFNLFFMRVCFSVCVWSVYLGSKSPAAGPSLAVRLCVRTYSSVFGEGIMRDERPTSTQNRMKGRNTEMERESIYFQQACSPPVSSSLLFSCAIKRALLSKVPHRTRRACIFSIGGSAGSRAASPLSTLPPWRRRCHAPPVELCGTTHLFPPR